MFWRFNLFGLFWAFLILLSAFVPPSVLAREGGFYGLGADKAGHFVMFAVLQLLLCIGFAKQYDFAPIRYYPLRFSTTSAFGYGLLMELFQLLVPGRYFEWWDLVANLVGIGFGAAIYRFVYAMPGKEWD